jgi:hypothetical protein
MNLLQAALNRARDQLTRRYGDQGYAPPVAHMKPTLAAYDCVCCVDPSKQLHTLGAHPLRSAKVYSGVGASNRNERVDRDPLYTDCTFRRQCNGFVTDSFSYTAQTTGRREGHP